MANLRYRRAKPHDARDIVKLIGHFSVKGVMLPRPYTEIVEKIRDFTVAMEDDGYNTTLRGIVALHTVGEDMAEIRSLAVDETCHGRGIGKTLVGYCIRDGLEMGLHRIFTLTYQTEFFGKMGFEKVEKMTLPQKIWGDCIHCAKFTDCDEVAMIVNLADAPSHEKGDS